MAFERKPGRGVIFRDRQKKKPNGPDFRSPKDCTVIVDGVERVISFALWEKSSDKAGGFFSFAVEVKDAAALAEDDSIPF